ncbi:MAG: TIGR02206 family membrane protein [Firmicutes bacterium]|nr:TIGR02206 family membrane protein [Bacillota bacterium]
MAIGIFACSRLRKETRRRVMKALAVSVVMLEVARTVWALSVGHYDLARMLPLHLCGVMIFFEFFAVFTGKRLLEEFVYNTGLPGAFMALLTPEPSGYPLLSFQYLQSITVHALLALIPLLWLFGDGFRPNIKYLPKSFLLLSSLAVFDALVNKVLHSNYLFISKAPAQTPIELFDKWVGHPWYVGLLLICVVIVWTLLYLPWTIRAAAPRKTAGA